MISNGKIATEIKTLINENFNPFLGISISRLAVDFKNTSIENEIEGIWVFICGAENKWSLNHKEYDSTNKWFQATIDGNAVVYDSFDNKTNPKDVYINGLVKLMTQRNHFVLDHEDAGMFIPVSSFKYISNIQDYELPI